MRQREAGTISRSATNCELRRVSPFYVNRLVSGDLMSATRELSFRGDEYGGFRRYLFESVEKGEDSGGVDTVIVGEYDGHGVSRTVNNEALP